MSNYLQWTKHPETHHWHNAYWMDDHFGHHKYGVRFNDGKVFKAEGLETSEKEPTTESHPDEIIDVTRDQYQEIFGDSEPVKPFEPVVYVFLNKSLHMSVGKAAAQSAHAMAACMTELGLSEQRNWAEANARTVIVLEARDETHMKNIEQYMQDRNIAVHHVIDEGVNEIDPHVYTALVSQVLDKNSETAEVFKQFKLYRDPVTINVRYE